MTASPKQKTLKARFFDFSVPLEWRLYCRFLIRDCGFEMINKSGSCRAFVNGDERFIADEPHGKEPNVSKEDRKKAIKALARLGLIDEDEE